MAIVAERLGGQVNDTVGIENLISVPKAGLVGTTPRRTARDYPCRPLRQPQGGGSKLRGEVKELHVKSGEAFLAKQVVIATGAGWRKLNVEGESTYLGPRCSLLPHCDGPFYKGKRVAGVGGGNSGVEAAIDLAGICSRHPARICRPPGDEVLREKARVWTMWRSSHLANHGRAGRRTKGDGHSRKGRSNDAEREIDSTLFYSNRSGPQHPAVCRALELSPRHEIVVDATAAPRKWVFTPPATATVPYKQIIVAMGEGAKAALSAFDDRVRNKV